MMYKPHIGIYTCINIFSQLTVHYKERIVGNPDSSSDATLVLLHGFNGSVFNWYTVHAPRTTDSPARTGE